MNATVTTTTAQDVKDYVDLVKNVTLTTKSDAATAVQDYIAYVKGIDSAGVKTTVDTYEKFIATQSAKDAAKSATTKTNYFDPEKGKNQALKSLLADQGNALLATAAPTFQAVKTKAFGTNDTANFEEPAKSLPKGTRNSDPVPAKSEGLLKDNMGGLLGLLGMGILGYMTSQAGGMFGSIGGFVMGVMAIGALVVGLNHDGDNGLLGGVVKPVKEYFFKPKVRGTGVEKPKAADGKEAAFLSKDGKTTVELERVKTDSGLVREGLHTLQLAQANGFTMELKGNAFGDSFTVTSAILKDGKGKEFPVTTAKGIELPIVEGSLDLDITKPANLKAIELKNNVMGVIIDRKTAFADQVKQFPLREMEINPVLASVKEKSDTNTPVRGDFEFLNIVGERNLSTAVTATLEKKPGTEEIYIVTLKSAKGYFIDGAGGKIPGDDLDVPHSQTFELKGDGKAKTFSQLIALEENKTKLINFLDVAASSAVSKVDSPNAPGSQSNDAGRSK